MMAEIAAIVWKEWKELFGGDGRRTGWFRIAILILMIGVLLPAQAGADWVDGPFGIALSIWVAPMLIVAIIADAFAGERERHTLETLLASRLPDGVILTGKIAAAVLYGFGVSLLSALIALITVNVVARGDGPLVYGPMTLAVLLVYGLLVSLFAAGAGVLVSLRAPTVRHAQQTLSIATLLLVFVPAFALPALPGALVVQLEARLAAVDPFVVAALGALILGVADAVLLTASALRFRRDHLIAS